METRDIIIPDNCYAVLKGVFVSP